jgi:hypothetical protein
MKKVILYMGLIALMSLATTNIAAQVTIGADLPPSENAVLDLKMGTVATDSTASKGLALPRVALTSPTLPNPMSKHERGMVVYNITSSTTITPGFYCNDGTKWVKMDTGGNWFYMPSFEISTATIGTGLTKDLYNIWIDQFSGNDATTFRKNPGAPATVLPFFPARTDLNYYVTFYDNVALEINAISDNGVMSYRVKATATEASFVNIVFVLK